MPQVIKSAFRSLFIVAVASIVVAQDFDMAVLIDGKHKWSALELKNVLRDAKVSGPPA